jgi:uncharacterized membrane protein
LGLAFGGLSSENHKIYVLATVAGLIFIGLSVFKKSKKWFIFDRSIGLLLVPALIVFDIRNSFMPVNGLKETIKALTYFPLILFFFYAAYSLIRIVTALRQTSANTSFVK